MRWIFIRIVKKSDKARPYREAEVISLLVGMEIGAASEMATNRAL